METIPTSGSMILLPTAYFPPVDYFALLTGQRPILIEQMETYHKQTFRNRCEIMSVAGKTSLVIPVSRPGGNHTTTCDVLISHREPWQRLHWRALQTAYNSSPFFNYYSESINALVMNRERSLVRYNLNIIQNLCQMLRLKPDLEPTADFIKSPVNCLDLRDSISPKKQRVELNFKAYPQVFSHLHGFIPRLSILDLLFNLGPDAKGYLEELAG